MRRLLLLALCAISISAHAEIFTTSPSSGGGSSPTSAVLAVITQRAPTPTDGTTSGWVIGDSWQYNGTVYTFLGGVNGAAVWIPQVAQQYPLYANPVATSYNGQGLDLQQRPLDILGTTGAAACGLVPMLSGYTGKSIQVTTTVSASPTTTDIKILNTGLFDTASFYTAMAAADAGTSAYVSKCYDQSGNGLDFVKYGNGPTIGSRSLNGIPEMSWGYLQGDVGLTIPAGFTATGKTLGYFQFGEFNNATGHNVTVVEFGAAGSGPSLSIFSPVTGIGNNTGWEFFTRSMGSPSPLYPALYTKVGPQVFGLAAGPTTTTMFTDNNSVTITWGNANTTVGGYVGRSAVTAENGAMASIGFVMTNFTPTTDQIQRVKNWAYANNLAQPQIKNAIWAIGDSRTQAYYTNGNGWPVQMNAMLNAYKPVRVFNEGVGGQTAQYVATDAAVTIAALKVAGAVNIAEVGPLCTNDIAAGTTPAQCFAYTQSICATLTAGGFTTVAVNELPRTGTYAGAIATYQALFSAGPTGCTYSLSPAAMSPQLNDATNTVYFPDGLHLSDAGQGLLAQDIAQTIAPLLN